MNAVLDEYDGAQALFLETWMQAVLLAGPEYFQATAEGLTPNLEAIRRAILPREERVFLYSLVSFFNAAEARSLFERGEIDCTPGAVAACLDDDHRLILATLMDSYTGQWW